MTTRRQVLAYTPPILAVLTTTAFSKGMGSAPARRIEPVPPRKTVRPATPAEPADAIEGTPRYTG